MKSDFLFAVHQVGYSARTDQNRTGIVFSGQTDGAEPFVGTQDPHFQCDLSIVPESPREEGDGAPFLIVFQRLNFWFVAEEFAVFFLRRPDRFEFLREFVFCKIVVKGFRTTCFRNGLQICILVRIPRLEFSDAVPHPVPAVLFEEFDAVSGPAAAVLRPAHAAEFGDENRHIVCLLKVTRRGKIAADHLLVPLQALDDGRVGNHFFLRSEPLMAERKRRVVMNPVNDIFCMDRTETIHGALSPPCFLLNDHPAIRVDSIDPLRNRFHQLVVIEFRFDPDFHFVV